MKSSFGAKRTPLGKHLERRQDNYRRYGSHELPSPGAGFGLKILLSWVIAFVVIGGIVVIVLGS
jgi:hypothetical protein